MYCSMNIKQIRLSKEFVSLTKNTTEIFQKQTNCEFYDYFF